MPHLPAVGEIQRAGIMDGTVVPVDQLPGHARGAARLQHDLLDRERIGRVRLKLVRRQPEAVRAGGDEAESVAVVDQVDAAHAEAADRFQRVAGRGLRRSRLVVGGLCGFIGRGQRHQGIGPGAVRKDGQVGEIQAVGGARGVGRFRIRPSARRRLGRGLGRFGEGGGLEQVIPRGGPDIHHAGQRDRRRALDRHASRLQLGDIGGLVRHIARRDRQRLAGGRCRRCAVLVPPYRPQRRQRVAGHLHAALIYVGGQYGFDGAVLEDRAVGAGDAHGDGRVALVALRALDVVDVDPLRRGGVAGDRAAVGVVGTGVEVHVADLRAGDAAAAEDRGRGAGAGNARARVPLRTGAVAALPGDGVNGIGFGVVRVGEYHPRPKILSRRYAGR